MKTVANVLACHESAAPAAKELCRRFTEADDRRAAALAWCEHFGAATPWPSLGDHPSERALASAHELLRLATAGYEPLSTWTGRAESKFWARGIGREATSHDATLLEFLLGLWPLRSCQGDWPVTFDRWKQQAGMHDVWHVACDLADYPDLAFRLLGPLSYAPPDGPCFGCGRHPRDPMTSGYAHFSVVVERAIAGCPPDPRDAEITQAIPPMAFFEEPELVRQLHRWFGSDRSVSPLIVEALELALQGPFAASAAALLCHRPDTRSRGVAGLADAVRAAPDLASVLRPVTGDWILQGGLFRGRGWGRKDRPRVLLPLTRALLQRGEWPAKTWCDLLHHEPVTGPDHLEDRAFDLQREVLAEGLLAVALDTTEPDAVRARALDGLERLSPKGDGSWARALGKLKDEPVLAARARKVRQALKRNRGLDDAELAIQDALELFLPPKPGR